MHNTIFRTNLTSGIHFWQFPAGQLSQISSLISWEPKTIKKPCTSPDFRVVTLATGLSVLINAEACLIIFQHKNYFTVYSTAHDSRVSQCKRHLDVEILIYYMQLHTARAVCSCILCAIGNKTPGLWETYEPRREVLLEWVFHLPSLFLIEQYI